MPLDDITSRILQRARDEADAILAEAKAAAERRRKETEEALERERQAAETAAAAAAEAAEARVVAAAETLAKREKLVAMQRLLDEVLDETLATVVEGGPGKYLGFLRQLLLKAPMQGEAELLVSEKDAGLLKEHLDSLQRALDEAGRGLRLRLSEEHPAIRGGLILRQGKIEYNASLEAIRRTREEELRSEAARRLFGEDDAA